MCHASDYHVFSDMLCRIQKKKNYIRNGSCTYKPHKVRVIKTEK